MIYLPLEHIEQRYTTHLDRDILDYLKRKGKDYSYLIPKVFSNEIRHGSFLDADNTVYRQFHQMQQLIECLVRGRIAPDETLFVTDIWNFGLMAVPYLNFFSGYKLKVRGIVHAGSFTDTDFVRQMERVYKGFEESLFDICDRIYVGSQFIKDDIIQKRYVNPDKLVVTGLPLDWLNLRRYADMGLEKRNLIVFNGRNVDEKQPYLFDLLQKKLPQYEYINTQKEGLSKEEYYKVLAQAKCIVSFALQENFGYGVQEAVALGCVPALPDRLAYREQFAPEYRYSCFDDCVRLVGDIMEGKLPCPDPVVKDNDRIFDTWFEGL